MALGDPQEQSESEAESPESEVRRFSWEMTWAVFLENTLKVKDETVSQQKMDLKFTHGFVKYLEVLIICLLLWKIHQKRIYRRRIEISPTHGKKARTPVESNPWLLSNREYNPCIAGMR